MLRKMVFHKTLIESITAFMAKDALTTRHTFLKEKGKQIT